MTPALRSLALLSAARGSAYAALMSRQIRCPQSSLLSLALVGLGASGCYVGAEQGETYGSSTTGLSSVSDGAATDGSGGSDGSDGAATDGSESGDGTGGVSATAGSTGSTSGDGATGDGTGASATDGASSGGTTGGATGDASTSTTGMSTGSSSGSTGGTSTSTGGMGEYCDADDDWMGSWSTLEEQVLTIVNEKRSQGANCGGEGSFGPTGPLMMDPQLRCAARLHSQDMVDRDFFAHTNPDGESPWDRIEKTGYGGYQTAGENIAAGSGTAAGVVDQWMNSDGHCANIMKPAFNELGVGYYPGGDYGHVWTQVFTKK